MAEPGSDPAGRARRGALAAAGEPIPRPGVAEAAMDYLEGLYDSAIGAALGAPPPPETIWLQARPRPDRRPEAPWEGRPR